MHRISIMALGLVGCMETGLQGSAGDLTGLDPLDTGAFADTEDERAEDTEDAEGAAPEQPPADEPPAEEPPVGRAAAADDCDTTSDLVYVIDRADDALYLFDPETPPSTSWAARRPVRREPRLDVRDPRWLRLCPLHRQHGLCGRSRHPRVHRDGLRRRRLGAFGMGFATDSDTTWQDTLYANDNQLARMDTATWTVSPMGSLPVSRAHRKCGRGCGPYFHSRSPLSWSVSTRTPPRSSTPST